MWNHYDSKHSRVTLRYTTNKPADAIIDSLRNNPVLTDCSSIIESVIITETRRIKWSNKPVAVNEYDALVSACDDRR